LILVDLIQVNMLFDTYIKKEPFKKYEIGCKSELRWEIVE